MGGYDYFCLVRNTSLSFPVWASCRPGFAGLIGGMRFVFADVPSTRDEGAPLSESVIAIVAKVMQMGSAIFRAGLTHSRTATVVGGGREWSVHYKLD
ncbi:hypothetical protein HJFPF1_01457 [Paramyrothecium foliicola]|nr:hypothetical protein HJFPF1_01457 [Paramyrothecium foliicola]